MKSNAKPPQYFVLDDVMSSSELLYLYHTLQTTSSWTLSRHSKKASGGMVAFGAFPGLVVEGQGEVMDHFLSGYFRCLTFRVRQLLKEKYQLQLPENIQRIHLGAKNSFSKTEFHKDSNVKEAWTILGFLNPTWDNKDGGEFYIKDDKIDYKSARFVIFKSNLEHNGGYITNDKLAYWRISLNIILCDSKPTLSCDNGS